MNRHKTGAKRHIDRFTLLMSAACAATGAAGAASAADVEITANAASVNLDAAAGSTVHVAGGISVGPGSPALSATLQAWSLTNDGSLSGSNTVKLTKGGSVTNTAGATIASTSSAVILGTSGSGGLGTVVNGGTITGGSFGDTVALYGGGTVTNLAGGSITATNSSNTVSISGGTSRTVINSGLISNTGTGNASGILIQGAGATNTITNTATGRIVGGYNGIYASPTAALTVTNAGTISSTRGAAIEASLGGTFTNSGTIASANASGILTRASATAEVINSGTISGAVNAIDFTASGGGAAASHTVRLQNGSVLNGNVRGAAGTDNLILEGSGSESIAKFLNFETLAMQGSDWTLTDSGTFTSGTTVQSGTLRVTGQLTSPTVSVFAGGTLSGTGTIVGTVTNAGNVRIDAGTLTVNGNYVHQAGADFTVGLTPTTSGLLAITGTGHTATINGGMVRVLASFGVYALNTTYTILSAPNGRIGAFAGATSNFAFLTPSLSYDATTVYLTLVRNSIDVAGIGQTPNQIAAGGGVQSLPFPHPISLPVLLLKADQARAAFDSVSGEIHASLHTVLLNDSRFAREAMLGRLSDASGIAAGAQPLAMAFAADATARRTGGANVRWPGSGASAGPIYTVWAQGFGNWLNISSDGNAAALHAASSGGFAGLDVTLANGWRFGALTGGRRTDATVDARTSRGGIDTVHAGAYGGGPIGPVELRGGIDFAHHDLATDRLIAFSGFSDRTSASYGGTTWQAFGELAYRLPLAPIRSEMFVTLAHAGVSTNPFTERGGFAALIESGMTSSATTTTLGLRGSAPLPALGPWQTTVRGSAGWQHAFDAATPQATAFFNTGGTPFVIAGLPIATDAFAADAGFDTRLGQHFTLSVGYSGRIASTAVDHAVRGNLQFQF